MKLESISKKLTEKSIQNHLSDDILIVVYEKGLFVFSDGKPNLVNLKAKINKVPDQIKKSEFFSIKQVSLKQENPKEALINAIKYIKTNKNGLTDEEIQVVLYNLKQGNESQLQPDLIITKDSSSFKSDPAELSKNSENLAEEIEKPESVFQFEELKSLWLGIIVLILLVIVLLFI